MYQCIRETVYPRLPVIIPFPSSSGCCPNFPKVDVNQGHNRIGCAHCHMDNFALLRALSAEQRARDASDPAVKKEWEALAIEWHLLANTAAKATNKVPQTKWA